MDHKEALKQKAFQAEKQISYIRVVVIAFGTVTFFFLKNPYIHLQLAYFLLVLIWLYGLYIPIFKPYEKFPIFRASWFTYISDSVFATLWIYATGGFYSPYHVMFYTSIIAVSFRFNLKTTLLTSSLYTLCYFSLLWYLGQLSGNETLCTVRMGFVFIIGFMTHLITTETLFQTQQKLSMKKMVEEIQWHHDKLKQSQAQLSSLNEQLQLRNNIFNHAEENATIGSYAWNLATNKLEYSDNLYRLLGCEPGEFSPTMEKYLAFLHPDDKQKVVDGWEKSLKDKVVNQSYHRIITKEGKIKYIRATGKMTGQDSDLLVIGTLQDITTDVELNEAVKQKNLELERSNDELASFNYIASHDLQEPLRKIQTFTKLITEKETNSFSETGLGYITRISLAAGRMQHLIDAFLNYSRITNSKPVFEKTDMNVIVEEVISHLTDTIQEKNATIEKTELPVLPLISFQVQQLFINLISNALKYSKKDIAPVIRITAQKVPGRDLEFEGANKTIQYWAIRVEDNGIGFDPKYSDKIFEVFQRLHNKEDYEGTGIGLAICKKIALFHHGYITATGAAGAGAIFTIYFPSTNA